MTLPSPLDQRPQYQGRVEAWRGHIVWQGQRRCQKEPGHQTCQRHKRCEERKEPDDYRVVRVQDQRDCMITARWYGDAIGDHNPFPDEAWRPPLARILDF